MTDVFGPLVDGDDVETYCQAAVHRWFPTYLYQQERRKQLEPGSLPLLRSIVRSSEIERFPEEQLPCWMFGTPGLTDPPEADGGGYYSATWQINSGVEVVAAPNRFARQLAQWYALGIRACLIQQQQDPGLDTTLRIVRIDWRDERYDVLDSIDDRTVCVGKTEFAVTVAEVLQRGQGPLDPIIPPQEQPGPDAPAWPSATSVITTTTKEQ